MNELFEAIKTIAESDVQMIKREEYNGHYFYESCPKCEEKIEIAKKAFKQFDRRTKGRPKAYLIRVVTWDDLNALDNAGLAKFAYELNSVLSVHHAEIFNEEDFMRKCEDEAALDEIDLYRLFVNVLHIPEETVKRIMRPWEMETWE